VHRVVLKNLTLLHKSYSADLLQVLIQTAETSGAMMYLVGGTIRDCLLGLVSHDLDLAVSGQALPVVKILQRRLGGGTLVDLSGPEDEAVRLVWRGEQIDIAAFRAEAQTIEEDLRLRDFTINAMAVPVAELGSEPFPALIDPTGGLTDLQEGWIRRCAGAFAADPLRMLRGYRLAATLGFQLDDETKEAIGRHASRIVDAAAERISYELKLIFDSTRTAETLRDMGETGLLRQLLPELYRGEGVAQPEFHHLDVMEHCFLALEMMEAVLAEPTRFFPGHGEKITGYLQDERSRRCLKWAALLHDIGKPATREIRADREGRVTFYRHDEMGRDLCKRYAERSKWSRAETELVAGLVEMHMHPFHLCNVQREGRVSKRAAMKLSKRAGDTLVGLFLLAMSDSLASRGEKKPERMEEELVTLFATVSTIYAEDIAPVLRGPRLLTGRDLIEACHLEPGPLFSEILEELEITRVEGTVVDRQTALAWVNEFLQAKNRAKRSG